MNEARILMKFFVNGHKNSVEVQGLSEFALEIEKQAQAHAKKLPEHEKSA